MSFSLRSLRSVAVRALVVVAVLAGAMLSPAEMARAATYKWIGAAGGLWNTTTNWTPSGLPGLNPNDVVVFENTSLTPATYLVNLGADQTIYDFNVSTGGSQVATLNFNNLGVSRELEVTGRVAVGGRGASGTAANGTFNLGNAADAGTQTVRITGAVPVTSSTFKFAPFMAGYADNGTGTINLNERGSFIVGTSALPVDMFLGVMSNVTQNIAGTTTGTLNLNGGSFVGHIAELSIGRRLETNLSDTTLGNGIGALNAQNFAGSNLDITVYGSTYIGRGRTGTATLSQGTLRLGNPLNTANQTIRLRGLVEIGTMRHATGLVELDENGTLEVGTSAARSNVRIGWQGSSTVSTSFGTLDVNGGTFAGWIDDLEVGVHTAAGPATAVGRGRVDLSAITLGADGNVLDVNTASIGGRSTVTTNGTMDAIVNLGAGSARFGTLYLGRNTGAAGDQALLTLDGTRLEITNTATIGGSGDVEVTVGNESAGFEVVNTSGTALTMSGASTYDIMFAEDLAAPVTLGSASQHDEILYGLMWEGNHVTELQALVTAGRLDWDDTTNLTGEFLGAASIFFDLATNATYVGMYLYTAPVPEPSSALLLGLGAVGLVRATRRRRTA